MSDLKELINISLKSIVDTLVEKGIKVRAKQVDGNTTLGFEVGSEEELIAVTEYFKVTNGEVSKITEINTPIAEKLFALCNANGAPVVIGQNTEVTTDKILLWT